MKTKRSLSGCYFRFKNPDTDKWENWCFEDLPIEDQKRIMDQHDVEWTRRMVIILADTLNEIGEHTNIAK